MRYSSICPECKSESDKGEAVCPACGAKKAEDISEKSLIGSLSGLQEDILEDVSGKIDDIEGYGLYIKVLIRTAVLLAFIFLIPDVIRESDFFWMLCYAAAVFSIMKMLGDSNYYMDLVYIIFKKGFYIYLGTGFYIWFSYAVALKHYSFGQFFNPAFIYQKLTSGNGAVIFGIIFSTIIVVYYQIILRVLKESIRDEKQ